MPRAPRWPGSAKSPTRRSRRPCSSPASPTRPPRPQGRGRRAGVGKTELAKSLARALGVDLIRLQCYEGLDEAKTLYEWKYPKQLLYTQVLKQTLDEVLQGAKGFAESVKRLHEFGDIFFSEEFLEARPLLKALQEEHGCVLLIDEVDKSDHEFESLLLELLSDFQVSIPEI